LEVINKHKPSEEHYLTKKFYNGESVLKLNPHQIDDYLSCPLKFKYVHILRIPILRHHAVIYGSAIHKAIEKYFVYRQNNHKVTSRDLIKAFKDSWESAGFITREHEEKRLVAGYSSLKAFFQKEEKEKRLPTYIEKKFSFILNTGPKVKISGRYDAIYEENSKLKTQNSKFVEIRDFKTGEVANQEKANSRAQRSRQMSIYALAFNIEHKRLPDEVSLYFVDKGILGKTKKAEKDIEKLFEEIKEVVKGIKENRFAANPAWGECGHCAFYDICPYTQTKA